LKSERDRLIQKLEEFRTQKNDMEKQMIELSFTRESLEKENLWKDGKIN
jgi:hypothetical protein